MPQFSEREREAQFNAVGVPAGIPKSGTGLVKKVRAMLDLPQHGGHAAVMRVAAREAQPFLAMAVTDYLTDHAESTRVESVDRARELLEPVLQEFLKPGAR